MRRTPFIIICALLLTAVITALSFSEGIDILEIPPANQYGNMLMNRLSGKHGQPWVIFSHWSHRMQYTCRVCHLELEFEMKVNATEITEDKNRNGEYCGACHNGKTAFGHTKGNCAKCHNGNIMFGKDKFVALSNMPIARFGNQIDWSKALMEQLIRPRQSIFDISYSPMPFKKELTLEAVGANIAPVIFSHQIHAQWLDCANCHPDIFNIKKKTTEHFSMKFISQGKFCGVCHRSVAFPINDCNRCHCGIEQ